MSEDWSERPEAGSPRIIAGSIALVRRIGRGAARVLLAPVALYFFLRRGPERRASRAYLARVFGRPAHWWEALRHMHTYSQTMLDRVFLLAESFRRFDIRVEGLDRLHAAMDRGRGVLLLGAHVGSFEALSVLKQERPNLPLKFVMDPLQTQACNNLLYQLNPDVSGQIIEVGTDPGEFALQLQAVALRGGVIGLLGDRIRDGEAAVSAEFFGAPARFPAAPYLIASALKLPVVLGFGIYRGGNRYDLHFELFADDLRIARGQRAEELRDVVQRYAARLEHYLRSAPYNWFNFYDFWRQQAAAPRLDHDALAGREAA